MHKIKFGTDGWRGRIADDYTFDNLRRCAQGFAEYLQQEGLAEQGIVIGHDQRFQAEDFAAAAAEVLAANGIHVWLTESNTPTPTIKRREERSTSPPATIRPTTAASRCATRTAGRLHRTA